MGAGNADRKGDGIDEFLVSMFGPLDRKDDGTLTGVSGHSALEGTTVLKGKLLSVGRGTERGKSQ